MMIARNNATEDEEEEIAVYGHEETAPASIAVMATSTPVF